MSRRSRPDAPQPEAPEEGLGLRDGVLLTETITEHHGARVIEVRGSEEDGRAEAQSERDLLVELAEAGVRAAPRVIALTADGYLRELSVPLQRGDGRRTADLDSPDTEERLGRSQAREDLEDLLDALHERGWVLGAPSAAPLALRPDGSVTVLELGGLQPSRGVGPRLADRHWLDLALDDGDRTLPRSALDVAQETIDVRVLMRDGAAEIVAGEETGPGDDSGIRTAAEIRAVAQVPSAEPRSDRAARLLAARRPGGAERGPRRNGDEPAPLAALRSPRTLAVLIGAGLLLGILLWALLAFGAASTPTSAEPSGPAVPAGIEGADGDTVLTGPGEEPPRIHGADGVAADLLRHRHQYITGQRDDPVAVPDSSAARQDRDVRDAYTGTQVDGGEPDVLQAEWLRFDREDGEAALSVELSTPAHTVTEADGEMQEVAATAPVTVVLELEWDGARWVVREVREQS